MFATASKNRRLKIRDGFWLCLAIGFHALLLLIPLVPESVKKPADATVIVTLLTEQEQEQPFIRRAGRDGQRNSGKALRLAVDSPFAGLSEQSGMDS
jgi:hypothetical protein